MSSHAGIPSLRVVSVASAGITPSSFCRAKVSSRMASQPCVEAALVPVGPLRRDVVRGVRRTRREVREERLVRRQRLLLARPGDRLVRHVVHEVVALLGGAPRIDRGRVLVDVRVPLVGLAADEPVEVLEPAAGVRPVVEGSRRVGLPHRHLVALAELRRVVAVQPEDLGDRCARVGAQRVVARRRRGDLGDAAHADRVVVAARQQRGPRRRAQGGRVEAGELQALGGQPVEGRRLARPAEAARRTEADVIDQDHEHVGRAVGRRQPADRGELGVGRRGVVGDRPGVGQIRDRQRPSVDRTISSHQNPPRRRCR